MPTCSPHLYADYAHAADARSARSAIKDLDHRTGAPSRGGPGVGRHHVWVCRGNYDVTRLSQLKEETSSKKCSQDDDNRHHSICGLLSAQQVLRFPLLDREVRNPLFILCIHQ